VEQQNATVRPPPMSGGLVLASTSEHVLDRYGALLTALTAVERQRCRAMTGSSARDAYLAAHLLVRVCAARMTGADALAVTVVQRCSHCKRPHGRPRMEGQPGLDLTLSHAGTEVAAAAAWGDVGVDVELLSALSRSEDVEAVSMTSAERAAFPREGVRRREAVLRQWVRKEALVKAGAFELDDLVRRDLSELPDDAHVREHGSGVGGWRGWRVYDWAIPGVAGAAVSRVPLVLEVTFPVTTAGGR
jgi:4'-phosphopantetheinyl transferase